MSNHDPRNRHTRKLLWAFGLLVCIYMVGPILTFIPLSLNERSLFYYPIEDYSFVWYEKLFASPTWMLSFYNSAVVAIGATALATVLGVAASIGLWRSNFAGKRLIMVFLMLPTVVPGVVAGVSMYLAFSNYGLNGTYTGLILAHAALAAPMVVITVSASLARFDPTLLRAAASLGASPALAFRRVTLPLILPGVVTGAVFAFSLSLDDVVVSLFVAGPQQRTLPVVMYFAASDMTELTIVAAATLMLVLAGLLMAVFELMKKKDQLKS